MQTKNNNIKTWQDENGQEVPVRYIPKLDKQKDKTARKLHRKAKKLNEQLRKFKEELFNECDGIFDEMKREANVRTGEDSYTITSFDKSIKIEVKQAQRIAFDDNISLAKEKLNEYLDEKLKGQDDELRQIVHGAFETKKGELDPKRVLSLFSYNINHKKWKEAMELIQNSIDRNKTKRYARVYERDTEGEYHIVDLNWSSV